LWKSIAKGVFFVLRKRRIYIRTISFAAALLLVLGGLFWQSRMENTAYRRQIQNQYQHAFADFVTSVYELENALEKCGCAASSVMQAATFTEAFGKAQSAQLALGTLPFFGAELERTAAFLAKAGDYIYYLSRTAAGGQPLTEEQQTNLSALSDCASVLSGNLTELYTEIVRGDLSFAELEKAETELSAEEETFPASLSDSMKQMETEFPEIPALIYDGPFSEHIAQATPLLLADAALISVSDAQAQAEAFLSAEGSLSFLGERGGALPVYLFSSEKEDAASTIEVTKQGGRILCYSCTRNVEAPVVTPEEAAEIAAAFLEAHAYPSMQSTYWMVQENQAIVNFAYSQDGVLCYPDLVKVTVALDTGEICGFESLGYIMHHTERTLPAVSVSQEDAGARLSPRLQIRSANLAVIPTAGKLERFCHEFVCETEDGRHYIVYINTETGEEEKILILQEDESGTLTI